MQNSAVVHTPSRYMNALAAVLYDQIIRQILWPARSPDLNSRNFYFWIALKEQVHVDFPQQHSALKFSLISCVPGSIFRRVRKIAKIDYLAASYMSVRPHRTTRLPLDEFNEILHMIIFQKYVGKNSSLFKI